MHILIMIAFLLALAKSFYCGFLEDQMGHIVPNIQPKSKR